MRQLGFSLILCIAPILAAPSIGALLYPDTIGRQSLSHSTEAVAVVSSEAAKQVEDESAVSPENTGIEPNWLSAGSSSDFDPNAQADFILSFRLRALGTAKLSKRQRVIRKYSQAGSRANGWALAFKRFDASVRPELFINDQQGSGEWFTFDSVALEPGHWSQFFMVRRKDGSTGLFVKRDGDASEQVRSLGGYDTSHINLMNSTADLYLAPPLVENAEFKGEVEDVTLIRPESLPKSESKLIKLLADFSLKPEETFSKEEVKLFVRKDQRDHSVYAHPLKVVQ